MRGFRSLNDVARSMAVVGAIVACAGAAMTLGPGLLNPWRFWRFFVVVGIAGLFTPGVVGAAAGLLIPRRAAGSWSLGAAATSAQLAIAGFVFAFQFFVTPISALPLVLAFAWAAANAAILVGLVRYRHQWASDGAARGFAIDVAPRADSDPTA